jgi:hypothetical protein
MAENLREFSQIDVRNEGQSRRFVEGVFWVARSGAEWRSGFFEATEK